MHRVRDLDGLAKTFHLSTSHLHKTVAWCILAVVGLVIGISDPSYAAQQCMQVTDLCKRISGLPYRVLQRGVQLLSSHVLSGHGLSGGSNDGRWHDWWRPSPGSIFIWPVLRTLHRHEAFVLSLQSKVPGSRR